MDAASVDRGHCHRPARHGCLRAQHVGKEDVYAADDTGRQQSPRRRRDGVASVQRAFLENDQALQGKRRLIAATFGCLLLSALLIGLLNVGDQAYTGVAVSKSATHTQATVHGTVGPTENKTLGPESFDKQAIVPGGCRSCRDGS